MTDVERTILADFRRRLSRRLPLHDLVLFGSRTRGDAEPDSDQDVVVRA